jgi:hypothetical protein
VRIRGFLCRSVVAEAAQEFWYYTFLPSKNFFNRLEVLQAVQESS